MRAVQPVPSPVTLATIKADPRFADLALVKFSRLSVAPVSEAHWQMLCELGKVKHRKGTT
jgi:predicted RNA-binding protein with PUA-like domain